MSIDDEKEFYIYLGKKLKSFRHERDISQKQVALLLGISFQQYQKYEKGLNRLPLLSLIIICKTYNISLFRFTDYKEYTTNYSFSSKIELPNFISNSCFYNITN